MENKPKFRTIQAAFDAGFTYGAKVFAIAVSTDIKGTIQELIICDSRNHTGYSISVDMFYNNYKKAFVVAKLAKSAPHCGIAYVPLDICELVIEEQTTKNNMNKEDYKLVKIVEDGTVMEEKTVILYENATVLVCVAERDIKEFFAGEFFETNSYEKSHVEVHEINRTIVLNEVEHIVTAAQLEKIKAILDDENSV